MVIMHSSAPALACSTAKRAPVVGSVAATWTISRQCERLECALMSWRPTRAARTRTP